MKKISEINEGFMTRSLNRHKSGKERLENTPHLPTPNNLKDLEPIDIGLDFLIADKPLMIQKEQFFNKIDEMLEYIDEVKKVGWRLPLEKEVNELLKFDHDRVKYDDSRTREGEVFFYSEDGEILIKFNASIHDFFINTPGWKYDNGISCVVFNQHMDESNYMKKCAFMDTCYYTIRLVRNK